jgi:hypothetical protein
MILLSGITAGFYFPQGRKNTSSPITHCSITVACEIGLNVTSLEQDSGNQQEVCNRSRRSPLSVDGQTEDTWRAEQHAQFSALKPPTGDIFDRR